MSALNESAKRIIRLGLVDDHEISRLGLRSVLNQFSGFAVVSEHCNGKDAIEAFMTAPPDVVIMDVNMPEMNGIDATRHLKTHQPSINILMLTDADHDDEVFAAFAAGADGYCLKHTTSSYLHNALISVYQGAAWIDPAIAKRVLQFCTTGIGTLGGSALKPGAELSESQCKFGLTERELEVLHLIVEGFSNKDIAEKLCISENTVKTHNKRVMEKLSVSDRTQAAVKAFQEGLIKQEAKS